MPFEQNLSAFKHASWGGTNGLADLVRLGDDWSQTAFTWALSSSPGGTNVLTLTAAPEGQQGISAAYEAQYVHPVTGDVVGATIIRPQIDQASFEAIADTAPHDAQIVLHHTLYAAPPGEPRRVLCFGNFTIKKGAPGA